MNRQGMKKARKEARQVAEAIQRVAAHPCVLCGRTPACGAGVWVPTNPVDQFMVGTPPGKVRVLVYALCPSCRTQPGVFERVERQVRLERLMSC